MQIYISHAGEGDVDFFGSEILYRIGCNLPCNAHTAVLRDHVARRAAGYAHLCIGTRRVDIGL